MITSQARANARPTPAAAPLTAAMKILSVEVIVRTKPPNWRRIQRQASVVSDGPDAVWMALAPDSIMSRAPPAHKAGPWPVMTMARRDGAAARSLGVAENV